MIHPLYNNNNNNSNNNNNNSTIIINFNKSCCCTLKVSKEIKIRERHTIVKSIMAPI